MCRRVTCPSCKRPTFAGCGAHIEQVLGDVPPAERCHCNEAAEAAPPARTEEAAPPKTGWLRSLLGR